MCQKEIGEEQSHLIKGKWYHDYCIDTLHDVFVSSVNGIYKYEKVLKELEEWLAEKSQDQDVFLEVLAEIREKRKELRKG